MSLRVWQHLLCVRLTGTARKIQSLKTSCCPQMLPTDDVCWALSKPSGRKEESSCFAPDRAHKGFQAAGPGIQLRPWEARKIHLEGQRSNKELLHEASPLSSATLLMRTRCMLWVLVIPRLTADACLSVSPANPFKTNHYFQGHVLPPHRLGGWQVSMDSHLSFACILEMTYWGWPACTAAARAASEPDL